MLRHRPDNFRTYESVPDWVEKVAPLQELLEVPRHEGEVLAGREDESGFRLFGEGDVAVDASYSLSDTKNWLGSIYRRACSNIAWSRGVTFSQIDRGAAPPTRPEWREVHPHDVSGHSRTTASKISGNPPLSCNGPPPSRRHQRKITIGRLLRFPIPQTPGFAVQKRRREAHGPRSTARSATPRPPDWAAGVASSACRDLPAEPRRRANARAVRTCAMVDVVYGMYEM